MKFKTYVFSILISWVIAALVLADGPVEFVIAISVDGMGSSYMQSLMDAGKLPAMKRIADQGAGTNQARNDFDFTITLPNHTGMLTSRAVLGTAGNGPAIASHNWTDNNDPPADMTLTKNKGQYIASVFDVVHDHGLRTGLWASKSKFSLFITTYNAVNGQPDATGRGHGKNKIDIGCIQGNTVEMTSQFIATMTDDAARVNFAFLHYNDPDGAGHHVGWGSAEYCAALIKSDGQINRILSTIDRTPALSGKTVIIVTADHGGVDKNHGNNKLALDYTIPFYVWGAGVMHGDLYASNRATRLSPGTLQTQSEIASLDRPDYAPPLQPIRNSEMGNLSLSLLGLPAIAGSSINAKQDLAVTHSR